MNFTPTTLKLVSDNITSLSEIRKFSNPYFEVYFANYKIIFLCKIHKISILLLLLEIRCLSTNKMYSQMML